MPIFSILPLASLFFPSFPNLVFPGFGIWALVDGGLGLGPLIQPWRKMQNISKKNIRNKQVRINLPEATIFTKIPIKILNKYESMFEWNLKCMQCANLVLDLHSLNLMVSKRHIELKYINAMAIAYAHKSHVIYLYYLLLLCLKNGMKIYEMRNDAWNWRLKYQNFFKFFTNNSLFRYSFLAY